jgi:integrase
LTEESKNLAKVETRQEEAQREGTAQKSDIKGKIINYTWQLKKQAYAETTIKNYGYLLKALVDNGANLYDPENIKETIAKQQRWCPGRKNNAVKAYNLFAAIEGINWIPPKYRQPQTFPFIPTEREIDDLIAGTSKPLSAFLQFLKETAVRRGEAYNTRWSDLDLTCRTIRITPEKGSNPRIFHISETLATKLGSLPRNSERIFAYSSIYQLEKSFRRQRKRLVHKLANPRLLNIHCHTFRHWKATMEYYRTRDIFHVMQFLGHRKIENTLLYIQLANSIFKDHDDHYVCKVAKTAQEAMQLIELGFEYVTGEYADGGKLFKKRKLLYLGSSSEGL